MDLQGKTALITGAARRIGRQIALTLAEKGASIVLHYSKSKREAVSLQQEIRNLGSEVFLIQADFSPCPCPSPLLGSRKGEGWAASFKKFLRSVYRAASRIDILINNASIFYPTPFGHISEKDWDRYMTVNLKAPFLLAQEIGRRMLRQKSGKIVNLVDWTALRPNTRFIPYAVSKAGLISATYGLAKALAPYVQVNGIAPGPILAAERLGRSHNAQAARRTLVKRFGNPGDIAETVEFLIGSHYITGTVIAVDGGASIAS